jgi:murein DD-endopeptidase MepM/ murein hydrolase activator NlpD
MELIVLARRRRIQRAVHVGPAMTGLLAVMALALLAGAFWLGHGFEQRPLVQDPRADLYAAAMRKDLASQKALVDDAVSAARSDLDALALRLSELQARAIRLDALGERLVAMGGMDPAEFSFGNSPPRGGQAPAGRSEPNRVPDFIASLEGLSQVLDLRVQELAVLETSLVSGRLAKATTLAGSPLSGGWISSMFGSRSDPMTGQRSRHFGVDFAGKRGSPIRAVAAGIVVFSGTRTGLGRVVEIDHGNGYMTRYAHNLKNLVTVGQRVAKAEHVALLGSSGRSTGNHVHFEILHNGKPLDPMPFIRKGGTANS